MNQKKEEVVLQNNDEVEKNKRAFTLIVKNNLTGEEICNTQTNIIMGCYNNIDRGSDDAQAIGCLVVVNCDTKTKLNTINSLTDLVNKQREDEVRDFLKRFGNLIGDKDE